MMTARTIETTVTFLEMTQPPRRKLPPPGNLHLALMQAVRPSLHYYRYLYETIGAGYHWIDRKHLDDDALSAKIHSDTVEILVAYLDGNPAGFYELDYTNPDEIWLIYLGIMPDHLGRGIGKWLLSVAINAAWSKGPKRVRVETCTLDHPRALQLYQKQGFEPYAQQHKIMELPDH